MTELHHALLGDSAHTPPANILEALPAELAHHIVAGAPHTIYQELWHIVFWIEMSRRWIEGEAVPYPERPEQAFPNAEQTAAEAWPDLCRRFFVAAERLAAFTADAAELARTIECTSPGGKPSRRMTIEDQLISAAAHNAYHFGRIVLLRQLLNSWPPPSGGFSW